jgi:hypothetical protein
MGKVKDVLGAIEPRAGANEGYAPRTSASVARMYPIPIVRMDDERSGDSCLASLEPKYGPQAPPTG